MNRILQFRPHLRVEVVDSEHVFLLGEREQFLLRGSLYALLAPLIDGQRTVLDLIQSVEGLASPPEVHYALSRLLTKGYLWEVTTDRPLKDAAFWQSLGVEPLQATERLANTNVVIHALGDLDCAPLREALTQVGMSVPDMAGAGREPVSVWVVLTEDYLMPGLDDWNRRALREGLRWMLLKPVGVTPWLGPLFRPGEGPCWSCLAHRVQANRPVETFVQRRTGVTRHRMFPRASVELSQRAAVDFAVLLLARWIAEGGRGALHDQLFTLDYADTRVTAHSVVRRPQCGVCGKPRHGEQQMHPPVALVSRPKHFTQDGGHRILTPEETWRRHACQISPITGVVTSLGPATGQEHPLRPVYRATFAVSPSETAPSFGNFQRINSGKGRAAIQARVSALCEAIERHSGVFQGDEVRIRARQVDLGSDAIHPQELWNFSETQYREREALNAGLRDRRQAIPAPFDEQALIEWTPLWSLTKKCCRYLPTQLCYFDTPSTPGERIGHCSSNGHAAGNCLEEAILQGFLELVERDAVAMWWYNRVVRPGVDLRSFDEPFFLDVQRDYAARGTRIWVLDLTTDLEIPAFVALSQTSSTHRLCAGFGCHWEVRLAVQRALTELNQLFELNVALPAAESDIFLFPSAELSARTCKDFPERRREDLSDDVRACVEHAERVGLETLVLDQTRPDVGLSVVKVVVPGLRHFRPQLAPGRLYDVPVQLGWRDCPLKEDELNPMPLFL